MELNFSHQRATAQFISFQPQMVSPSLLQYINCCIYLSLIGLMVSSRLIWVLVLLIISAAQQQAPPKLIFVQEIFRHGARYPQQVKNIGDEFVAQEQVLGELTDQGRSMQYLLGQQLYQRYWKKLFGGTKYEHNYDPTRFYIKSTNVNRTIESVQSQLYGIFQSLPELTISQDQLQFTIPPYPGVSSQAGPAFGRKGRKYHPTVVYTEKSTSDPTEIGDFLYAFSSAFCPNQHHWMSDNPKTPFANSVYSNESFANAMKELSLALSDNKNPNLVNKDSFYQYYDNLICLQSLGKPVPDLIVAPSQTKRALDYLYSINANIAFSLNQTQVEATATPFFRETIRNIQKTVQSPKAPQWVIYSAHDATLTVMLGALKLWSAECIFDNFFKNASDPFDCITTFPKFATIMVFEVYKYEKYSKSNKDIHFATSASQAQKPLYTIKINFNGNYKKIPFCDYKEECEVRAFEEWVDSWAVEDFVKMCGVNTVPAYQQELKLIQYGTLLTFVLCSIWFFMLSRKARKVISSSFGYLFVYLGVLSPEQVKMK